MPSLRAARRPSLLGTALTTAGLLFALSGSALAVPVESADPAATAARYGPPPAGSVALPLAGPARGDSEAEGVVEGTEARTVVDIPADVTAGVAVFDRVTGRFTQSFQPDRAFRSASVVKLLLALDFLWSRGPDHELPQADRDRLEAMLSRSDDDAANHYWSAGGSSAVVSRMVPRLGLTGTAPPPAGYPGYWGYTATTAADTVRVYRYLLDAAPAPVRDLVMGALHRSERCAADGFDQGFGLPSAFDGPRAVKQGWSGFASGGCTPSGPPAATPGSVAGAGPRTSIQADGVEGAGSPRRFAGDASPPGGASATAVDLTSDALHTTGTVGPDDRTVVAVLTLHPDGTPYGTAYSKVTALTSSLDVPGAVRPSGTRFTTWGNGVRVRASATTSSAALTTLPAGVDVLVGCQRQGGQVSVPPYVNDWWAYLPQYGGWITNIYITSSGNTLPGVPRCS